MKKHEDFLTSLFRETQFILGQEINQAVEDYFQITRDAAKKIVQRAVKKGVINSSAPLSFGKGQYAYFPRHTNLTKSVFYKITKSNRPSLYRLMNQIEVNGGVISYFDALRITGAPISKGTTKVKTLNELINELEVLEYVVKIRGHKELDYIVDKEKADRITLLSQEQYSNMVMDCSLIPDVLDFLKRQNIIDNKNIIYRNQKKPNIGASHNGFLWDAFAYTKTTGINTILMSNSKSDDKSTLVVLDVVLSSKYSTNHL